jgi:hypothetical protein
MLQKLHTPVMDVLPWPQGQGFAGATSWWDYMLSKDESRRLDNLMGVALLDEEVSQRLVNDRDDTLLASFGLSKETRSWLRGIPATSLVELAEAIVSRSAGSTPLILTEAS